MSYGSRGVIEGMSGGRIDYGSRSGSYNTARGGTINYGGRGRRAAEGPGAGRPGAASTESGHDGRAAGASRTSAAPAGPSGRGAMPSAADRTSASRRAAGRPSAARAGFGAGPGGSVAGRPWRHRLPAQRLQRLWRLPPGLGPRLLERPQQCGLGLAQPVLGGLGHGAWDGLGLGMGLGWGLSSWGYGSCLYGMGYMPYYNPYYGGGAASRARPCPTTIPSRSTPRAAPADGAVAEPGDGPLRRRPRVVPARELRRRPASRPTRPWRSSPTTPPCTSSARSACSPRAATTRPPRPSTPCSRSGPAGTGRRSSVSIPASTSTRRSSAPSKAYCGAHRDSATARFVLAYHYLTQGHTDAAVDYAQAGGRAQAGRHPLGEAAPAARSAQGPVPPARRHVPPPAAPPADTTPPQGATIAGTWTAQPVADTTIALTIQPGGAFNWQVTQKGQTQQFSGTSTFGDGILTLAQDKGPALVGRVSWKDASHMTFRIVGDGPDDPGLRFSK